MRFDIKRTWWIAALVIFAGLLVYFSFFGPINAPRDEQPAEEFPPPQRRPST